MKVLKGTLKAETNFKQFSDYSVRVKYFIESDGFTLPQELLFPVNADGHYAIELPADSIKDKRTLFELILITGEIAERILLAKLLKRGNLLKDWKFEPIEVKAKISDTTIVSDQIRVSGRVFNLIADKKSNVAKLTVRVSYTPEPSGVRQTIFETVTDGKGYFAANALNQSYQDALVEVLGIEPVYQAKVALLEDGRLPNKIIIALESQAEAECDCHNVHKPPTLPETDELTENSETFSHDLGNSCEDFTLPNRTLEEFNFYKIVRTTDPQIKGLELPGVNNSSGLLTANVMSLALDKNTLARSFKASDAAYHVKKNSDHAEATISHPAARSLFLSTDPASLSDTRMETSATLATKSVAENYINLTPLKADGTAQAASWHGALDEEVAQIAVENSLQKISPEALKMALEDPDNFTPVSLMTLERKASAQALQQYLTWRYKSTSGRDILNEENPLDWDESPEFYQATSIAHGHILHFKQTWKADGYSLGEVVQSIPLAPCQKKQIVTFDWDRDEYASRSESLDASEALSATLSRDRDINEVASAAFSESIKGGSEAKTGAVGGGFGLAIGPLVIGGGGGSSWASSSAWQDSSRNLSAQSMQQLRDNTSQGAAAIRNQRATVVQVAGQSESVGTTTEVIANHNHCHAMTVQYFEVLRHFAVQERLAGVQECLFVPLQMAVFDDAKVLRWKKSLRRACGSNSLRRGFSAIERLNAPQTSATNSSYADDIIEEISGRLRLRVAIARPKDPVAEVENALDQTQWGFLGLILRVNPETLYQQYSRNAALKDQIYRNEIAPDVARKFLESLKVIFIDKDGAEYDSQFEITILSKYRENRSMTIELNDSGNGPRLTRRDIVGVEIRTDFQLPDYSKIIVERARINYKTERLRYRLFNSGRVLDDLLAGDPAYLSTSDLAWIEERNKLKDDRERRSRLLRHLNDNLEYYHRTIWWQMDADRRFMLLDGFEAPNSNGRSVASVVENRLLGIIGNSLIMPVSAGFQLDPVIRKAIKKEEDENLLEHLYDVAPSPPRRLSVPTNGVFAEAMKGQCNSCEEIEEDLFWRWSESPCPDSPPPIGEVSTASRRANPASLSPTGLPAPIVQMQQLPDAPNPTGMAASLELLGKDVFKDLTGLTLNQKNAMASLTTAMGASQSFAGEAFKLAIARDASRNLDRTLAQVQKAKDSGNLTPTQASQAARDAILRSLAEDPKVPVAVTTMPEVKKALDKAATSPNGSATITKTAGDGTETVSFNTTSQSDLTVGAGSTPQVIQKEFWLDSPILSDTIDSTKKFKVVFNSRNISSATNRFMQFNSRGFFIDTVQAGMDNSSLRVSPSDSSKFQVRGRMSISYPANPKKKTELAALAEGEKYPVVIMIHGMSRGWAIGGLTPTGRTKSVGTTNYPIGSFSSTVDDDHKGYEYLQKHLSDPSRKVVTISLETNLANIFRSMVEMRAQMLLDALEAVRQDSLKSTSIFHNKLDFNNVGILGHSRGGEAVIRAYEMNAAASRPFKFGINAVCSLAPTDMTVNSTNKKLKLKFQDKLSYFSCYGGLDGDVTGKKFAGRARNGNAFSLFDRCESFKVSAFIVKATHNRFNSQWSDTTEWRSGVPVAALSEADHFALAKEYIGGYFDLALNKNNQVAGLFDNSKANSKAADVAILRRFGSKMHDIDTFESANPARGAMAGGTVSLVSPRAAAATASVGDLDLHNNHNTKSMLLDVSAAGATSSSLTYNFNHAAGSLFNASIFNELTFSLGQLYPVASQTKINTVKPPEFDVIFEDDAGLLEVIPSKVIYARLKNGWTKPIHKVKSSVNSTQMFKQTLSVDLISILTQRKVAEQEVASGIPMSISVVNLHKLKKLKFKFDISASSTDLWIDDINFIRS